MCFSATASFSAGAVLLGLGTLTLKSASRPREIPFAAAYAFYATWFISVWCFFAALLSAVVYLHFVPRKAQRSGPVIRQPARKAAA